MPRITVYLSDDQQEWVERVSEKIDDSQAEVIRRVVDAQREKTALFDGASAGSSNGNGPAQNGASSNGVDADRTRAELIERIEKLEEQQRDQETAEEEDTTDESFGWR